MHLAQSPPPVDPFVVRVDTYENHLGNRVFDRVLVSGTAPAGFHRYVGTAQINVNHPVAGPIHHPYNFVIDADTVDRAFALFEASAQAEGQKVWAVIEANIRKQMNAVQAVPASALKLLDSSGNPLKKEL